MSRPYAKTLRVLVILLASLATTALSHAIIGVVDRLFVRTPDGYGAYAHVGFAPVVLGAAAFFVALVMAAMLGATARGERRYAASELLARCARLPRLPSVAVVAAAGGSGLVLLEACEQLLAFGHTGGLTMSLGGALPLGFAAVLVAAALVVVPGLALVREIVHAAAQTVVAVVELVLAELRRVAAPTLLDSCTLPTRAFARLPLIERRSGLRAPPHRG